VPDYLDTSAFIKLVRAEPESRALRRDLGDGAELVSSALLRVEGRRAAARYGALAGRRARAALVAVTLIPLDDAVLDAAAELEPPELRSLDALHLAAALSIGDDLERFYCYDRRLVQVARSHGLDVRHPS
jgi:predicted nucleic acid-binding protein